MSGTATRPGETGHRARRRTGHRIGELSADDETVWAVSRGVTGPSADLPRSTLWCPCLWSASAGSPARSAPGSAPSTPSTPAPARARLCRRCSAASRRSGRDATADGGRPLSPSRRGLGPPREHGYQPGALRSVHDTVVASSPSCPDAASGTSLRDDKKGDAVSGASRSVSPPRARRRPGRQASATRLGICLPRDRVEVTSFRRRRRFAPGHHLGHRGREQRMAQTPDATRGVQRRHRRASDVIIMEPVSRTGVIEVIRTAVLGEDPRGCR